MVKLSEDAALGSVDLGIGGKSDRYVIHIRDSKSAIKANGQPLLS